jgi:hypothetical protein
MPLLRAAALALLAWAAAPAPAQAQPATCAADSLSALRACIAQSAPGTRIALTQDLTCRSAQECCPGGAAPLRFTGTPGLTLDGQGHTFRRTAGQRACQAVVVRNAPGLTLANLTFDEDQAAPPCELGQRPCASTLDIGDTKGLTLDGVRVLWGKGYVVRIWTASDVTIRRSEIADAGIIGLYAGHFKYGPTTNLLIEDSRFLRARTNGVALQGADIATIRGSRFEGNHWHGLWAIPHIPGGIHPGGQLYISQGTGVRAENNVFTATRCGNCTPSQLVTAFEIGEGKDSPGVTDLTITGNRICYTHGGWAIYHNPGSPPATATVANNRVSGHTATDNLRGDVTRSGNSFAHGEACPG